MTVLQQYALDQPAWRGKPGERSVFIDDLYSALIM